VSLGTQDESKVEQSAKIEKGASRPTSDVLDDYDDSG
jgi:hypothetical protein